MAKEIVSCFPMNKAEEEEVEEEVNKEEEEGNAAKVYSWALAIVLFQ